MENDFNPWKVKSLEDFTLTYVVYSCPECQRTFSTSEQFIGHAMMSHPKARDTLPDILNVQDIDPGETSDITEKSLVNPDLVEAVEVKQESELESVEVKSEIKEESLVNQELVEVKQESKLESVEMYQCNICGKSLRTERGRIDHMRTCQKRKNQSLQMYQCNICGKSFGTEEGRNAHLKTCQKRQYQRSKNLKKIMQKHTKLSKHA